MGQFRIEIVATGNHGCDRDAKEGESMRPPCSSPNCIDCRARDFVAQMQASGALTFYDSSIPPEGATLTHWPKDPNGGITDDLRTGKRQRNSFR